MAASLTHPATRQPHPHIPTRARAQGGGAAGPAAADLIFKPQEGKPAEEDLKAWGHHGSVDSVPDAVMQQIGGEHVSFVFSCQVRPSFGAALGRGLARRRGSDSGDVRSKVQLPWRTKEIANGWGTWYGSLIARPGLGLLLPAGAAGVTMPLRRG